LASDADLLSEGEHGGEAERDEPPEREQQVAVLLEVRGERAVEKETTSASAGQERSPGGRNGMEHHGLAVADVDQREEQQHVEATQAPDEWPDEDPDHGIGQRDQQVCPGVFKPQVRRKEGSRHG
jgi:hypothetical protein